MLEQLNLISILASISFIVGLAAILYVWKIKEDEEKLEKQYNRIEESVKELKTKKKFSESYEDEEFQHNVKQLANKLFEILKNKHGLSSTTYTEITKELGEIEKGSKGDRKELIGFFDEVKKMSYSDEDLTEKEKEDLKQKAQDLIKKTEQHPEQKEEDT